MADWLISLVSSVVERLGYLGLAILIAVENVFPPIPSELILPLAGFNVWQGTFRFPLVVLAATVGSVVGAAILYAVGRWLGKDRLRAFVRAHGSKLFLKESDVDRADLWFDRYGGAAVFLCRLLPVVRSLISIPAGIDAMPFGRFLVLTALGSAIWNSALIGAGWALGTQWERVEVVVGYLQYAVILGAAVLVVTFLRKRVAARRARAA